MEFLTTTTMVINQRPISHRAKVAQLVNQYEAEARAAFSEYGRDDWDEATRLADEAFKRFLGKFGVVVDEDLASMFKK